MPNPTSPGSPKPAYLSVVDDAWRVRLSLVAAVIPPSSSRSAAMNGNRSVRWRREPTLRYPGSVPTCDRLPCVRRCTGTALVVHEQRESAGWLPSLRLYAYSAVRARGQRTPAGLPISEYATRSTSVAYSRRWPRHRISSTVALLGRNGVRSGCIRDALA